jgi:chaperonin cofactor prefoldin
MNELLLQEILHEVKSMHSSLEVRITKIEDRMANVEDRMTNVESRMSDIEVKNRFNGREIK